MLRLSLPRNVSISTMTRVPALFAAFAFFVFGFAVMRADAQTTEFVFQGQLQNSSLPASGSFDFEFLLFDTLAGPNQIGSTLTRSVVAVANGIFSVNLDFGANYPGASRYLEIHVRQTGGSAFTPLTPRQAISSMPYSVKSLNTDNATNATQLGGVAASLFVQTSDSRLSDARNPLPNSGNYIQNTNSTQGTSNFNISGDGTAGGTLSGNFVNAATQYNIGGGRVLTASSFFGNLFAGIGAGTNTTGGSNSFFGNQAGQLNVTGANNSFFGKSAGVSNTGGGNNSFFGEQSGFGTSTGGNNSFFGQFSGRNNQTGSDNAFFGYRAGANNTATGNSFFGSGAGDSVTSGANNAFFGRNAGAAVITASGNSFFGTNAGAAVITVAGNSFFGFNAGLVNTIADNSFFGALAGDSNTTGVKNSFFGNAAGSANVIGGYNSFFGYHAGNVNAASNNSFFGSEAGDSTTTGANNSFFGAFAGDGNSAGKDNSFFGYHAGLTNTSGDGNAFFGSSSGAQSTSGDNNSFFGAGTGFQNTTGNHNSFFGYRTADGNTTGQYNSFFGAGSGFANTTGNSNSFFGADSGKSNTLGISNTFLGDFAGLENTNGANNTFVGNGAGITNVTGDYNTALGKSSSASSAGLNFSTAIGAEAIVNNSDTIVLGKVSGQYVGVNRPADTVRIPGNLIVSGSISKGSGSFRIDHPLDPANKYLYHSFVESPDMMNVYNGNAVTNENGEAEIVLPDYFEALNRDFRYQLTVIGQFAQVIVLAEVKDNRFRIKTDKPAVKVSWQVTGIRRDPFAEKNRIQTEVEKPENERGNYLHPELYEQKANPRQR